MSEYVIHSSKCNLLFTTNKNKDYFNKLDKEY